MLVVGLGAFGWLFGGAAFSDDGFDADFAPAPPSSRLACANSPPLSPFFLASSLAAMIRRTPGASVAKGFSMKTLIPCFTAYSTWIGRM